MALNLFRPGAPHEQPLAGLLPIVNSAIFVAVFNAGITYIASLISYYLVPCLGGADGDDGGLEQVYYDLYRHANFVLAMLGVALRVVDTAAVFRSPAWAPAVKWTVWVTKVLAVVTLTYSMSVLHSCVRM